MTIYPSAEHFQLKKKAKGFTARMIEYRKSMMMITDLPERETIVVMNGW